MKLSQILVSLPLLLAFPACDGGGDGNAEGGNDGPNIDCGAVTVPKYSEMEAVWARCTSCHSTTLTDTARNGATPGIDFDNYTDAKRNAQQAMDSVFAGRMPLGGSLSDPDKNSIYAWASCDTPE